MNIWSLEKDLSIKHLLLLLADDLTPHAYIIHNNSSDNHRAIRLCHNEEPQMCAYIYTYGHDEEKYGINLEYPLETEIELNNSMDVFENITYARLLELLKVHLDIIGTVTTINGNTTA